MQKKRETNKENSWRTQSQISFALFASEISSLRSLDSEWVRTQSQISFALFASEISSLRSLDSEWVRTQSLLKNNVKRYFLLLFILTLSRTSS
jgi:hypothetical protein